MRTYNFKTHKLPKIRLHNFSMLLQASLVAGQAL